MKPWKVINSRYLLRRWWLNIREDHVQLPDGAELPEFHVLEFPDWTCVICLDEGGNLVMVEQYRHGVTRFSIELPAGAVEPGEDPIDAAKRELLEETGYASDDWIKIGECAPEPSKQTNWAHIYFARGARMVTAPDPDESEHISVHLMQPGEVLRLADEGAIFHGAHLTALFWAVQKGFLPVDTGPSGGEV